MQKVTIRQIPSEFSESIGMAKYNRSRLPGTKEDLQASENTDGRYITGIDEDSFLVKTEEDKAKVKAKRIYLESKIGKDLSGTSDFWKSFYVRIWSDSDLTLDLTNPREELSYYLLIANRYIAPNKDAFSNPAYKDANYYAFTEESEIKEETSNRKLRDKAIAKLSAIEENKNKMVLIGQYLEGIKYDDKLGENVLYSMLREYIEQKDLKFARLFVKALDMSTEDMQRKILVDRAFKARLIVAVKIKGSKKSVYQFGQVPLGTSVEEVYTNLADAKYSNELLQIKSALEE